VENTEDTAPPNAAHAMVSTCVSSRRMCFFTKPSATLHAPNWLPVMGAKEATLRP